MKQLLRNNLLITGFILPAHKVKFQEYLNQLIVDVIDKRLRVVLDLGQNTSEGQFFGIDSVVRGVEV